MVFSPYVYPYAAVFGSDSPGQRKFLHSILHLQWWVAEIQAEGNKEILWSLVHMLRNVYLN